MSARSFTTGIPALLRRHPVLLAEWLQVVNALKRTGNGLWLVAAGVTLVVAAVIVFADRIASVVTILADYWMLTALVTIVYTASSVARRRRRIQQRHGQSWLIAAPIPQSSVRISHSVHVLLPVLGQFFAAALIVRDGWVIAVIAAGMFVGTLMGWRAGVLHSESRIEASRYARSKNARTGREALSGWPIAQTFAWSRPENSRYVLIVALFAVQGGSSALVGGSVVALYFVVSYLAALLSALLQVAKSAGAWLRATPMALSEFVWALSSRALVHQAIGTALAAGFMCLLGAPLILALQLAALWLGLVTSIWGCALVDSYRGRPAPVKIALIVAAWAALLVALQWRAAGRA